MERKLSRLCARLCSRLHLLVRRLELQAEAEGKSPEDLLARTLSAGHARSKRVENGKRRGVEEAGSMTCMEIRRVIIVYSFDECVSFQHQPYGSRKPGFEALGGRNATPIIIIGVPRGLPRFSDVVSQS